MLYAHLKYEGTHYCESARSTLQGDAQRKLDWLRREVKAGTYVAPRERAKQERARKLSTVAALSGEWLTKRINPARNENGRKLAESRLKHYLLPKLGPKAVADVSKQDIRDYRDWLMDEKAQGRKLNPVTVGHILADCRSFFLWAEDAGHVEYSPFPRGIMPDTDDREPKALPDAEVDILTGLPEPYGFACRIMLGTGIDWSNLVRVKASDVKDGKLVVTRPKTGKLRRIPVPPALLEEIKGHVGKLVPFEAGPDYFRFLKATRKLSGLDTFGAHQLRHTFAYRWIWKGGSLSALQAILGHASITTTEIYAKTNDALVTREAERLWAQEA